MIKINVYIKFTVYLQEVQEIIVICIFYLQGSGKGSDGSILSGT